MQIGGSMKTSRLNPLKAGQSFRHFRLSHCGVGQESQSPQGGAVLPTQQTIPALRNGIRLNPLKAGQSFRHGVLWSLFRGNSRLNPLKAGQSFRRLGATHSSGKRLCLNPLKAGQSFRHVACVDSKGTVFKSQSPQGGAVLPTYGLGYSFDVKSDESQSPQGGAVLPT